MILGSRFFNPLLRPPDRQGAQDQDQKITKLFEYCASKLHFLKFLASDENGRCVVQRSAIVIQSFFPLFYLLTYTKLQWVGLNTELFKTFLSTSQEIPNPKLH